MGKTIMLNPVSPKEIFDMPAGKQFYDAYVNNPKDPLRIHSDYIFTDTGPEVISLDDEERQRRLSALANWLTANYDPETNTHTLYRGLKDDMLHNFNRTGALTSRAVDFFGDGDVDMAIKNLKKVLHGKVPRSLKDKAVEAIDWMDAYFDSKKFLRSDNRWNMYDATKDLFAGKPSDDARQKIANTLHVLQAVKNGGEEGYYAVLRRADMDDTPPEIKYSPYALTHPSIHFTTDPSFITRRSESGWFNNAIKVTFEHGSLPVAPNTGIVQNGKKLVLPASLRPAFHEREWYGVGRIDSKLPGVHIEEIPEIIHKN